MLIETVSFHAAFIAGLLSFFSPCVLPLIPAYFTFVTGFSLDQLTHNPDAGIQRKVLLSTLLFVFGFSLIFILLGASATLVGRLVSDYTAIVMLMGGVLMGILGIHLTGLFRIHLLDFDRHINIKKRPMHMLSALLIGMAFGAGWSPCVGPLLGSILMIAGSKETIGEGILLLSVYSIGLGLPFIILSFFINRLLDWVKKASRMMSCLNKGAGILLILMGFYLVFTALINLFHFSW